MKEKTKKSHKKFYAALIFRLMVFESANVCLLGKYRNDYIYELSKNEFAENYKRLPINMDFSSTIFLFSPDKVFPGRVSFSPVNGPVAQ